MAEKTDTWRMLETAGAGADRTAVARVEECEDELEAIATDVVELADELGRLRGLGGDLGRLLAERETRIDDQRRALTVLEDERSRLLQALEAERGEAQAARARVAELDRRIETLVRENQWLRTLSSEHDRHLERGETVHGLASEQGDHRQPAFDPDSSSLQRETDAWRAVSERASTNRDAERETMSTGHVLFVSLSGGYRLSEAPGPCPPLGERLEMDGVELVVTRIGHSPLPADPRPCVFLVTT